MSVQVNGTEASDMANAVVGLRQPQGTSIFVYHGCQVAGCTNLISRRLVVMLGMGASTVCPLHLPPSVLLASRLVPDKRSVFFCSACHVNFATNLVTKHRCRCCAQVYCAHCVDYRLLPGLQPPIAKRQWVETPRLCVACAACLHPSQVRRHVFVLPGARLMRLDVCFVFDATASMTAQIANVERNIHKIVEDVEHHHVDVRFGAVAYRDVGYPPELRVNMIPFMKHHHAFESRVEHIPAMAQPFGENDIAEAPALGLAVAQAMVWRYYAGRVLILVADAPGHGWIKAELARRAGARTFSERPMTDNLDLRYDAYPDGAGDGLDAIAMAQQLAADGVTIFTVGVEPNATSSGAVSFLQAIAAAGNGMYISLRPRQDLHHYIAGVVLDVLMRQIAFQEMNQQRGANAVLGRLKRNTDEMPHLQVSALGNATQPPVVTGYVRKPMDVNDAQRYIDQVRSCPPPAYDESVPPTFQPYNDGKRAAN